MMTRSLRLTPELTQKLRLRANIVIDKIITHHTHHPSPKGLRPLTWIHKSILCRRASLSSSKFNPQSFETYTPFALRSSSCSKIPNVLLQPSTSPSTSTPFVMLGSTVAYAVAALAYLAPLVASMPAPMPADGAVKMIAARDPQRSVFVDPNAANTNVQVPAGSSLPYPRSQYPVIIAEVNLACPNVNQCANQNEYCYNRDQLVAAGTIGPDAQNCPANQPAYAPPKPPTRVPFEGGREAPAYIDPAVICPPIPNTFAYYPCTSKEKYCNALLQRNLVDTNNCNSQPAA